MRHASDRKLNPQQITLLNALINR
ncbi:MULTISPECIES: hypothetical protein [unclassified Kitasatospora]